MEEVDKLRAQLKSLAKSLIRRLAGPMDIEQLRDHATFMKLYELIEELNPNARAAQDVLAAKEAAETPEETERRLAHLQELLKRNGPWIRGPWGTLFDGRVYEAAGEPLPAEMRSPPIGPLPGEESEEYVDPE